MNSQENQALSKYANSLRALAGLGVPGAQEQSTAYEEILKAIEAEPFAVIEPPLFSDLPNLPHFPEMERLLASARDAFSNRNTKGELADALDEFIHAVSAEKLRSLPEAEILIATAKHWRGLLQQESEEALLILEKTVSLNLEQIEEDLSFGESAQVAIPLIIENRGIAPANHIVLNIEVADGDIELSIDRAVKTSSKEWTLSIYDNIQRNDSFDTILPIVYRGNGKIKLWLQGSSSNNPRLELFSRHIDLHLASNASPSETDAIANGANPYIPDQPLLKPLQWDKLAKGKHLQLRSQIMTDRELPNGRVLVIRGCRRSGKTTFLRRIEAELSAADNSLYLPVYIDVRSWFEELKSDPSITDEDLYYEFAVEIHAKAAELMLRRQKTESIDFFAILKKSRDLTVGRDNEGMTLSSKGFGLFAAEIEKAVDRKILLIIDELDWWINKSVFKGNAEAVLSVLAAPSLVNRPFSALISHDLTSKGWELKTNRTLLPRHVLFLERSDILDLAREAPRGIEFSDLAIDFVWRVSGGWQGLAQLVLYVAIDVFYQRAQGRIVDTGIVKKAVDVILGTSDYKNFLSYYFGSLAPDEWELLKTLERFVSIGSGEIKGLRYNSNLGYRFESDGIVSKADTDDPANFSRLMDSLREKEIVEYVGANSSKLRLRVGILAYSRTLLIEPEWS